MQLNWSDILARLQFEKGQFVLISNINKKAAHPWLNVQLLINAICLLYCFMNRTV
jgi:hypothetical protein